MDLVADAVTNKPTQLPTFHCIGVFLSKLAGHVEHSGKAQKDLQFITKLMFAERVRVGSLRISTTTWLSNVSTLTETVRNFWYSLRAFAAFTDSPQQCFTEDNGSVFITSCHFCARTPCDARLFGHAAAA